MMISKLLPMAAAVMMLSCSVLRKKEVTGGTQMVNAGTTRKDSLDKLKPYGDVITAKAKTQTGLLTIHQVGQRWFVEIADSLIGKDILIVNRISRGSAGVKIMGMVGYAGDQIGESMVRFSKGPDHKLFIERVSYLEVSRDSSENGMFRSVVNSTLQPIVAAFDIKAVTPDATASVIDITDYLNTDNDVFFFNTKLKKAASIGGLQADKSYIKSIHPYGQNVEIKTIRTYTVLEQPVTYELNSSIVLLPQQKMPVRSYDERVGYFNTGFINYDEPQEVKVAEMITRWRLEPKEEDRARYLRGELVEPAKPIVFYIDPATPRKWIPYLIDGINAWQKAFEKAGWKNAIYALEAPVGDSSWSLDDARHNVVVYKASATPNASGPTIVDPRTGEILESHINWYHNVQQVVKDWYFIQAAPNDPAARQMQFPDSLMGKLIRYVCTHEVGHTLGLQHNFVASASVPTDSLRSRTYVARNGHTPSIMDYARFNYVAQPEDGIAVNDLIPRIGVYDEWAIEWGYRWLPGFSSQSEDKTYMNHWVIDRLEKDRRLFFLSPGLADPRNQMEDLGDDAMKASAYGIKNLSRITANLQSWTYQPNASQKNVAQTYQKVLEQYRRYLAHVLANIGALYMQPQTMAQGSQVFRFQDRNKIRSAVQFFHDQLFTKPRWLIDSSFFAMGVGGDPVTLKREQEKILHMLMHGSMWNMLLFNETGQSEAKSYNYDQLLTDLESGIWKELAVHQPIDIYRRTVQKIYVYKLRENLSISKGDMEFFDYTALLREHLRMVGQKIEAALPYYKDRTSLLHLRDLQYLITNTLKGREEAAEKPPVVMPEKQAINVPAWP